MKSKKLKAKILNILFVADVSISQVIGGAERVLFEQATRLAKRGHNVHLLTRRLPGHTDSPEVIQGVTEWRYFVNQKNGVAFLWSTWKSGKKLFESIHQKYNIDCINFHQPFSAFGVLHSSFSKDLPKIYTCHSLSFEEFVSRNGKADSLLKKLIYLVNIQGRRWIEKSILVKSDEIIALSQSTSEKLWEEHTIPFTNISIVPGGVDLQRFHPAENKIEIRKGLNIPCDKVILFTVRNLVRRMGLENLIHALKDVIRKRPDVYFVLGGEGPQKNDLVTLVRELGLEKYISFVGFLSDEQLPDYYRMADIFVLPTRELEGFGLVTLEAMASGLPVLGTPVGGTKEILGKIYPHFLFEGTDADSMAKLILENCLLIKQNPQRWGEISHQCRQYVENEFSWEKNIDSLENIFFSHLEK